MVGIKYCLFVGNLLFLISGISLVIVGGLMTKGYGHYTPYSDDHLPHAFILIIVLGVLICFVGFLGCCGALLGHQCMLISFAVLVGMLFTLEMTVVVLTFSNKSKIEDEGDVTLERAVKNFDSNKTAAYILNLFQTVFKCCGKTGPSDYRYREIGVPGTCCGKSPQESCSLRALYEEGCQRIFMQVLKTALTLKTWMTMVVAILHLSAVVMTCVYLCLAKRRSIRKYRVPNL